eukprot:CAMPEP_0183729576 /NCGR_PEP_ID=MMETSP0737-20130205/30647_1 /TAXON_ID=385413 /ORGANISM="Thalassiosira miniscula, Strain CCMP1093" /LENGTH=220 /DNA_ID=CAMNT_0025961801 /DNA_START=144 /DNA_END=806 /DNA_ORIENTATION=-
MVDIDKTNKPEWFEELYQRANPLPGVRPKVPLLHVTNPEQEIVLCESTVIAEYVATMATSGAGHQEEKQAHFWPTNPSERAKLRLFVELCGSSFGSYLAFRRVQDMQQVETQYTILMQKMKEVDAFLVASATSVSDASDTRFTLAEAHVAPFVQRCCGILPPPYDPISIANQLQLVRLQSWIQGILQRDSVVATAPLEEIKDKREKLIKRLARIRDRQQE